MDRAFRLAFAAFALHIASSEAFTGVSSRWKNLLSSSETYLKSRRGKMTVAMAVKAKYDPKWKKQLTLAEQLERDGAKTTSAPDAGLIGTIPVVFKQGNSTKSTMALAGQPLSDVASQAGQYIKYGCGKGECGTCEALCNGKWIRPCSTSVPTDLAPGEELTILVKEIKSKSKSSGKFYSIRSFFMGFYNNLLGMVGFVKWRKAAQKNFEERMEYEDLVATRVAEKKAAKAAAQNGDGRNTEQ